MESMNAFVDRHSWRVTTLVNELCRSGKPTPLASADKVNLDSIHLLALRRLLAPSAPDSLQELVALLDYADEPTPRLRTDVAGIPCSPQGLVEVNEVRSWVPTRRPCSLTLAPEDLDLRYTQATLFK